MSPESQGFFSDLILGAAEPLLRIFIPILVGLIIWLVFAARNYIRSRLTASQYEMFSSIVRTAVRAAEQSGLAGYIENTAHAKKDRAMELAKNFLKARGLGWIPVQEIDDMVEAMVHEEFMKAIPISIEDATVHTH